MKKLLFVVFAFTTLLSCQKWEHTGTQWADDSNIYAVVEALDGTKTTMDNNNNVLWSDGDQIVAFMKTTSGSRYQIMDQFVETTTGGFSPVDESAGDNGEAEVLDHNVVLYPYSTEVSCKKNDDSTPTQSYKLDVVLPETQIYSENSFANGSFPMIAVSSSNQLTFKNVCGGVKLQFKGVNQIKSITLEGLNNELISGKAAIVGYADGSVPSITMDADQAKKTVTLDCEDGVQLDETTPVTFIIAVPPVTFTSGMRITVTDTDGKSKTYNNRSSNSVTRSNLLSFPVITYKQPASTTESVTDLSQNGTANCYLVKAAGKYKFKAVKGNSTTSVGEVSKVNVLWESYGTSTALNNGDIIKEVSYSDGYVTFSTSDTFKDGNAVISVQDEKGVIIWSWHIWCSDEGWTDQVYANNAGTMMDRNLGATSATPGDVGALGLLYQWGRKDPFLGACSITDDISAASVIAQGMVWAVVTFDEAHSLEYAVQNPIVYIAKAFEWCNDYVTDYTKRWMDSEKTMYDPCPAGYRVPKGGEDGFWAVAYKSVTPDGNNAGGKWELADGTYAWYPVGGSINFSSGKLSGVGTSGSYWSSTPSSSEADKSYRLSLSISPNGNAITAQRYNPRYRAEGQFVRCVRE